MPDTAFMRMYTEATVRECAAIWHFYDQRENFGKIPWLQIVQYVDTLVKLGNQFIDGVNAVAQERGLIDPARSWPTCPRCQCESCPGTTRLGPRLIAISNDPEP